MKHLLLAYIILFSCRQESRIVSSTEEILVEVPIPISKKLDDKEVPENRLTLNTTPESISDQDHIEENLYGKFHCDRAQFYIINNPQNDIYNAKVNSITLYYLDSSLCKTKYILKTDIGPNLIMELGSFRIIGFDFKNREVITTGPIISETPGGNVLNPALDNYELRWTFGNKEIRYRVNPESTDQYIYLEKEKNYEAKYKNVERYCI
jgi:hypothetical protein